AAPPRALPRRGRRRHRPLDRRRAPWSAGRRSPRPHRGSAMARRNPPWQRDELILALDLYFRHRPDTITKAHPEVLALSELLNALPIHPDRPDPARFRNVNGTYMKLCNFLAHDPDYRGKGLEAGGKLEPDARSQSP